MTFSKLIEMILSENNDPMSTAEIWSYAQEKGYAKLLNSCGKSPKNTLASIFTADQKKINNKFILHSDSPKTFTLKK